MKTVGDGTRAINFFIDTILITILAIVLFKWYNFYVVYWRYTPFHFGWFFFPLMFVYYFLFELVFLKTPGKWLTYSRVMAKNGKRPNWYMIGFRSLLRLTLIDLFFSPFLGGPLHDFASATTVVQDPAK